MHTSRHIRLQAFTRVGRHEMIARVRDALQTGGADLIDFQMFSNVAININFEATDRNLAKLREALIATGVSFDEEGLESLTEGVSEERISGDLNVTFLHDEPDLRIPVPPIPG